MNKKAERVPLLIEMLARSGGANMNEICETLRISRQMVYKYLEEIESLHIPITQKDDYNGPTNSKRWFIPEDDYFRSYMIHLSPQERILLRSLLNNDRMYKNGTLAKRLTDLKKKINGVTMCDPIRRATTSYACFKGGKDYRGKEDIIETLLTAIEGSSVCTVTYRAAKGEIDKTYDIEPYTWVDHGNALYCIVACPAYNRNIRILAVERIKAITRHTTRSFQIPPDYSPANYLNDSFGIFIEQPIRVRLRFESDAAPYARERVWGTEQTIEDLDGGAIILSFTASGQLEIKRWALSWGASALVLEPPELVANVRTECAAMADRYTQNM